VENLLHDIHYGVRLMIARPGFTAVAIVALALGIGANTAVFSVVNGVLLRPLNYKRPDRLLQIWEKSSGFPRGSVAYLNFRDWQDQNHSFDEMAAFRGNSFTLTGGEFPERIPGRQVSSQFFSALGAAPALGRDFRSDDDRPGAALVTIVSNQFWKSHLGGNTGAIGERVTLDGSGYTVIGVLPEDFHFYSRSDLYVCIDVVETSMVKMRFNHPGIGVIARLRSDVNIGAASAEMEGICNALGAQYPDTNEGRSVSMVSLQDAMVGDIGRLLGVLLGAVALVLLIACVNVANLLLARSAARSREFAIRAALGAGRWRIARQLLTESVLLALTGGILGSIIAWLGTPLALKWLPEVVPRSEDIAIDPRVLGFTLLVSVMTGVIFGLVPAIQASRPDLNESLKEGSRGSTGKGHRVRGALVVSEVALALVLLAGAGLLLRTFVSLSNSSPGFDPSNLLTFEVAISSKGYSTADSVRRFYRRLLEDTGNLPGVKAVSATTLLPLSGGENDSTFFVNGRPKPPISQLPSAMFYLTGPGYDRAMGIPLLRGRYFTRQDNEKSAPVAVVDQYMERLYFEGDDPVGKHISLQGGALIFEMEIVGVVGHVKQQDLASEAGSKVLPQLYMPFDQIPDRFLEDAPGSDQYVVVRTSSDPIAYIPEIKRAVRNIDSQAPVYETSPMEQVLAKSIAERRFTLLLLGTFALLALLLASIGIYGVMSYAVAQRTHEMGIRLALGAAQGRIVGIVVSDGLKLALSGVGVGLVGCVLLTRFLSGMLYGVSAYDPLTLGAVATVLAVVAAFACYIPARRAMSVDPIVALRYE
jgi:predicted permease